MVEAAYAEAQVKKLAQKQGYPAWQPEAESELFRIAGKYATSTLHLSGVIRSFIENAATCPDPSELKAALDTHDTQSLPDKCGKCNEDAWLSREVADPNTGLPIWAARRCSCPRGRHFAAADAELAGKRKGKA